MSAIVKSIVTRALSLAFSVLVASAGCSFDTHPLAGGSVQGHDSSAASAVAGNIARDTPTAPDTTPASAGKPATNATDATDSGAALADAQLAAQSAGAGSAGVGGNSSATTNVRGSGAGADAAGSRAGADAAGSGAGGHFGGTAGIGQPALHTCEELPALVDYGAPGPFDDARMFASVGPNSQYTLFRPDATLGKAGMVHPIVVWDGVYTADQYQHTLTLIASHGFVVIACNDAPVQRECLSEGLDWLSAENAGAGALRGKLDTSRELAIGYSFGAAAAIAVSDRPNIKATLSLHGTAAGFGAGDAWARMHAPLLLIGSTGDTLASPTQAIAPNFQSSQVQTFSATLADDKAGHMYVIDQGASLCSNGTGSQGTCETARLEHAPVIAWFRLWACGDKAAKKFFYGDDCVLCRTPWTNPQRKLWN